MEVFYSFHDLLEHIFCVIFCVEAFFLLCNAIKDLDSLYVFHHLVDLPLKLVIDKLNAFNYIWMIKSRSDVEFLNVR